MRRATRTRLTITSAVLLTIAVALSFTTLSGWWATAFGGAGLLVAVVVLLSRRFADPQERDVA